MCVCRSANAILRREFVREKGMRKPAYCALQDRSYGLVAEDREGHAQMGTHRSICSFEETWTFSSLLYSGSFPSSRGLGTQSPPKTPLRKRPVFSKVTNMAGMRSAGIRVRNHSQM